MIVKNAMIVTKIKKGELSKKKIFFLIVTEEKKKEKKNNKTKNKKLGKKFNMKLLLKY